MYQKTVLENGVRVVSEHVPGVRSVVLGIWVATGSRYERDEEAGVSHLIEHLLFKWTERRSAREIAEAIESVGGQLNAFTSKEYTCYYARVLDEHLPLAVDVLADMFFSSLFRPEDLEREKKVVQEEIRMYEDSPDEIIHDLFSELLWEGHPLSRPVLGNHASVSGIGREQVLAYFREHYQPGNVVVALAGNVHHERALELLSPWFSGVRGRAPENSLTPPEARSCWRAFRKPLEQVQVCLGAPAVTKDDERLYTLQVLNNILGGGASSRLFQKVREEMGLVYSIYSYYAVYQDAGLVAVHAGTSPENVQEVLDLVWKEICSLTEEGVAPEELARTKEQIKGSLLLALENVTHRMHRLGKSELMYGRYISPEEILEKVFRVTPEDVRALARALFAPERLTLAVLGNIADEGLTLPWAV